ALAAIQAFCDFCAFLLAFGSLRRVFGAVWRGFGVPRLAPSSVAQRHPKTEPQGAENPPQRSEGQQYCTECAERLNRS
ncbi:hypothetical protein, partial [Nocardia wallacei]|uniref:hypothetical protein n=1 Tax=Nocardia wallacei TaxID=480035 RepID=UPI0024549D42